MAWKKKQRARAGLIGFGWIDTIANSIHPLPREIRYSAGSGGTLSIPTGLNYDAHQRHMSPATAQNGVTSTGFFPAYTRAHPPDTVGG